MHTSENKENVFRHCYFQKKLGRYLQDINRNCKGNNVIWFAVWKEAYLIHQFSFESKTVGPAAEVPACMLFESLCLRLTLCTSSFNI